MRQENIHLIYVKGISLKLIESAIGQHLIATPECAKTYADDNFWSIGEAGSSFHVSVLESVYIKTQNPVLCKQKQCFLTGTLQVNNG